LLITIATFFPTLIACPHLLRGHEKSKFSDGYNAVQAASNIHRVIFENSLVAAP